MVNRFELGTGEDKYEDSYPKQILKEFLPQHTVPNTQSWSAHS